MDEYGSNVQCSTPFDGSHPYRMSTKYVNGLLDKKRSCLWSCTNYGLEFIDMAEKWNCSTTLVYSVKKILYKY